MVNLDDIGSSLPKALTSRESVTRRWDVRKNYVTNVRENAPATERLVNFSKNAFAAIDT
jgi:hypothetical protein